MSYENDIFLSDTEVRLDLALTLAKKAGVIALSYFRKDIVYAYKNDKTLVSAADQEVEAFLITEIRKIFPKDDILGEETGEHCKQKVYPKKFRWIIDPIDGTLSFLKGLPFFSVLIGIELNNTAVAGVMHFPALDETYYGAPGYGAFWDHPHQKRCAIKVSGSETISSSTFVCASVDYFRMSGQADLFELLSRSSASTIGIPDAYAFALVASGKADFIVETALRSWDIAAAKPIIEAAGGVFSDFSGEKTIYNGTAVAANMTIHKSLIELIASQAPSNSSATVQ